VANEHKNEEIIFNTAIHLEEPAERKKYLAEACKDDIKLRANVEALLKAHNVEGNFLDFPIFDSDITFEDSPLSESPGTVIGRYKLLERIGEGGMAVVYMAEQKKPISRKVALKIIKLGMDTKSVIARFEAERQALAMMDHPNIAKVLDAGATETGRPYFVMELVKGTSITEYCDKNKLNTKERLELFIQICHAVQHAHENGIIHRDIKPTNVMVTLHDGRPIPKVIDFGIAKAMNQRLTEKTLFTRYAQMIGTPAYMSPEQAEFSDSEIDVRTDIYSLGILLYEMLTGTTPFAEDQLHNAGYLEMQRIICKEAPVKPSTKLSTLGEMLTTVAERQKTKPDALKKLIRGDLDWIVMKAIDKDRIRRYETANDLAVDIEHYLHYEPISAGPPSTGYRLHKFVRRNRVAVITLSLVAAALAIGATTAAIAIWNSGGLSGKVHHAAGMGQRHVWDIPPNSNFLGGISHDGRYVSYVDWTAGNLAVYDQTANIYRLLTTNTDTTWKTIDGSNESSAISHDGKQIAYSWCINRIPEFYDLRIIDVDGTNMRVLYHEPNTTFFIMPYDFSPDSKKVLAYFSNAKADLVDEKTGTHFRCGHLVLVSAADGSVRTLRTWQRRGFPKNAFFSQDGRYVAYDIEQKDDPKNHDIFVLDLDSGSEISLIDHPANDQLCGWSPDGRRVVFSSDRSSKRDLWMIDVAYGVSQGEPQKLLSSFDGWVIGFTADGSFYYSRDTTACNVYTARLDSTGLNFEGDPKLVSTHYVGSTVMADWSPDGSMLAYRIGASFVSGRSLAIYSVQTSEERLVSPAELFTQNSRMSGPRWSPDGQSLLVCAIGQEDGYGLYSVNVETGLSEQVFRIRPRRMTLVAPSPDGVSIYLRSPFKLTRLDLASGRETEICPSAGGVCGLDVSPDGRWLAFNQGGDSLVVLPSTGGMPREVVHLEEDEVNRTQQSFVRWTPDGKHLLFCKRESQLWRVHVETGVQQQIGPTMKGLMSAAMHPDGEQIAFTIQQAGSALWVMENFLPD
jgi:serine/threonine protein kinase/Tol biopolymer transport system component